MREDADLPDWDTPGTPVDPAYTNLPAWCYCKDGRTCWHHQERNAELGLNGQPLPTEAELARQDKWLREHWQPINCYACGKALEPVAITDNTTYQLDNALWLTFSGGYGMFIESFGDGLVEPESSQDHVVICHECAHALCAAVPWIGKLLDPLNSHSHKQGVDWTGHSGWDLPRMPAS